MKPVVTALLILTAGAASAQDYAPKAVDYIPRPVPPLPTVMAAGSYAEAHAKAAAGQTVTLAVGVDPVAGDYHAAAVKGFAPGRYRCFPTAAGPHMEPVTAAAPQPQFLHLPSWLPNRPGGSTCPGGNCPR